MMIISTLTMAETGLSNIDTERQAGAASMDEEAFRAFYERTAPQLWAYLTRITGDRQAADDLVQESYYRFYRASIVFQSESHRRNSLFLIATNVARDRARRRRRGTDVPLPEADGPAEIRSSDDPAERTAKRIDVGRALGALKPLQRQILWLAYAQGSSHDEIAEIVGVSPKSIKSLLFRARRKVAEILGGGGDR